MHKELKGWIEFLGIEEPTLTKLDGGLSSRSYYRIEKIDKKFLVMDAFDEKETISRMIGIGLRLKETKIRTPLIRSFELHKGFMLVNDIGSTHLFDKCSSAYYEKAIRTLVEMQTAPTIDLKSYEKGFLLEEMNLMVEWYLKQHLAKTLECVEGRNLIENFSTIIKEVFAQPQDIFVHRDYHSKNLMIDSEDEIVVIDYQDAGAGNLTYDLVSLLYDAYVSLDKRERKRLIKLFKELKGIEVDDEIFFRWVDFTAIQRNLTQLGIFTKLSIENERESYLEHTPLVLQYILDIASKYPELDALVNILTPVEQDSIGFF